MTLITSRTVPLFVASVLISASVAVAQWTDDASVNTPVAAKPGEQTRPRLASLDDGTTYVSWLDNSQGGYDIYLQRLDADGDRMWDEGGLLVADRSFALPLDYDLLVDRKDNAWLAFSDDRFADVQITVNRISPSGTLLLGADGVQLTDDAAIKSAPSIAAVGSETVIVGWSHGNEARVASVNAAGETNWMNSVSFPTDAATVSDVQGVGDGTAIVLLVHEGGFGVPRHLYAQRYHANGAPLWGENPVAIATDGSLQFGHYPRAITTPVGGLIVAWYEEAPTLQVYVQRLSAEGFEMLPAGGLPVSTNTTRLRMQPSAAFDAASGSIYVFWRESDASQSQFGVYGQRISGTGQRVWGGSGMAFLPISTVNPTQIRTTVLEGDTILAFNKAVDPNVDTLYIGRFDAAGEEQWSPALTAASTIDSCKSWLQVISTPGGSLLMAWADDRDSLNDIYAQHITADGMLGSGSDSPPGDLNGDGVVNVTDMLIMLGEWGACAEPGNCPADLDGDDAVTISDLLILLANWG